MLGCHKDVAQNLIFFIYIKVFVYGDPQPEGQDPAKGCLDPSEGVSKVCGHACSYSFVYF